jgi:hypothetical protein
MNTFCYLLSHAKMKLHAAEPTSGAQAAWARTTRVATIKISSRKPRPGRRFKRPTLASRFRVARGMGVEASLGFIMSCVRTQAVT